MRRIILWLPLAVLAIFIVTVYLSLRTPPETTIRSHLIGKPLPAFALPPALPGKPGLDTTASEGRPRVINIFASWCLPCIAEAPQLMALKRQGIEIDAIAVRDKPEDVAVFLAKWGDPYARIGADRNSKVQLGLGSSGVPETFIVDGNGIIRHQHIGDIRPEHVDEIVRAWAAAR